MTGDLSNQGGLPRPACSACSRFQVLTEAFAGVAPLIPQRCPMQLAGPVVTSSRCVFLQILDDVATIREDLQIHVEWLFLPGFEQLVVVDGLWNFC